MISKTIGFRGTNLFSDKPSLRQENPPWGHCRGPWRWRWTAAVPWNATQMASRGWDFERRVVDFTTFFLWISNCGLSTILLNSQKRCGKLGNYYGEVIQSNYFAVASCLPNVLKQWPTHTSPWVRSFTGHRLWSIQIHQKIKEQTPTSSHLVWKITLTAVPWIRLSPIIPTGDSARLKKIVAT